MCAAGPPRRSFTHDETISQCASLRLCPDFHDRLCPGSGGTGGSALFLCADPVQQRFQQRGGVLTGAGGEPGGEQFLRSAEFLLPGTVQLVLCGFVPAVLVCGALLIESGVLQSGIIQPGVVPELFFQPADLFQALRQQQCDGPFGRDAGSLVLLSGPLVDDQAEVPVGV